MIRFSRKTVCRAALIVFTVFGAARSDAQFLDGGFNFPPGASGSSLTVAAAGASFKVLGAGVASDLSVVIGGVCTAVSGSSFTGSVFCLQRSSGGTPTISVVASSQNRLNPNSTGDVLIQPDGKILVTASCRAFTSSTQTSLCIARFNTDLTLDTSFAVGFAGNVNPGSAGSGPSRPRALALQPDGKILIAGQCGGATGDLMCVRRLTSDGQSDATFANPSGLVVMFGNLPSANDHSATGLQITWSGQIQLAGSCKIDVSFNYSFCVARLSSVDGAYDASFNTSTNQPRIISVPSSLDVANTLFVQTNEQLVMLGGCTPSGSTARPCGLRFSGISSSFSVGTPFPGAPAPSSARFVESAASNDFVIDSAPLPNGRFYVLINSLTGPSTKVRRYHEDGSIDKLWDESLGAITYGGTSSSSGQRVLARRNGQVMVIGQRVLADGNGEAVVHTLNVLSSSGSACTMDIDDDGLVNPLTDGLLLARAALGLSGDAVITGAVAPGARRSNWPVIRDYFRIQCGMNVAG